MFNNTVTLDTRLLPNSRRLTKGTTYLKLAQPGVRIPLVWDISKHLPLLNFLGYWLGKGYYCNYAVVIPCAKHIHDLEQIFDYIAQTFQCKYRICSNGLVKFDSTILKYTMLGFGFHSGRKECKYVPAWIKELPFSFLREFLKGYFTAKLKIKKNSLVTEVTSFIAPDLNWMIKACLPKKFITPNHWTNDSESGWKFLLTDKEDIQNFNEQIGVLDEKTSILIEKLINRDIIESTNETKNHQGNPN